MNSNGSGLEKRYPNMVIEILDESKIKESKDWRDDGAVGPEVFD